MIFLISIVSMLICFSAVVTLALCGITINLGGLITIAVASSLVAFALYIIADSFN